LFLQPPHTSTIKIAAAAAYQAAAAAYNYDPHLKP
jgi:hypothetical protein